MKESIIKEYYIVIRRETLVSHISLQIKNPIKKTEINGTAKRFKAFTIYLSVYHIDHVDFMTYT